MHAIPENTASANGLRSIRLLAPVVAIVLGVAALAAPAVAAAGWEYLENRDPYAKGVVAVAQHRPENGGHAMVRCWSATRVFDIRLGFPGIDDVGLQDVQLQFDVFPSISPGWRLSPNRRTLIIDRQDQPRVLTGLRRANDVTVVAEFADGTRQTSVLQLRGSSAAIGRVLEVCGPLGSLLR